MLESLCLFASPFLPDALEAFVRLDAILFPWWHRLRLCGLGRRCDHLAHACKPGVRRGVGHTVSVCLFRLGHTEFFALYAEPVHSGCDAKNLEQRPNSYAPGMCCASSASSCSGSRCDPPRIQWVGATAKLTEPALSEVERGEAFDVPARGTLWRSPDGGRQIKVHAPLGAVMRARMLRQCHRRVLSKLFIPSLTVRCISLKLPSKIHICY
jgi:hypothetical protein